MNFSLIRFSPSVSPFGPLFRKYRSEAPVNSSNDIKRISSLNTRHRASSLVISPSKPRTYYIIEIDALPPLSPLRLLGLLPLLPLLFLLFSHQLNSTNIHFSSLSSTFSSFSSIVPSSSSSPNPPHLLSSPTRAPHERESKIQVLEKI